MSGRLKLAVLISGSGTTLKNLIDRCAAGVLQVEIRLVVSSSATARGLGYAESAGIPTRVVERTKSATPAEFSKAIFDPCREVDAEIVAMGGFLQHVLIPDDFTGRVVNIHPSLIPAFCGRGYYGPRVHQAVLDHGVKVTGCTVHFADNEYDHGPIILQRAVPVEEGDSAESLARRVFAAECEAYPDALRLIAEKRVYVEGRVARIRDRDHSAD